jgi:hypothetical protein
MKSIYWLFTWLIVLGLSITGCKKDEPQNNNNPNSSVDTLANKPFVAKVNGVLYVPAFSNALTTKTTNNPPLPKIQLFSRSTVAAADPNRTEVAIDLIGEAAYKPGSYDFGFAPIGTNRVINGFVLKNGKNYFTNPQKTVGQINITAVDTLPGKQLTATFQMTAYTNDQRDSVVITDGKINIRIN